MAKLAHQTFVIQVSKAVPDGVSDELAVINEESIAQLLEFAEALISDSGAMVEITNGK